MSTTHTDVDIARAASTIEAWERHPATARYSELVASAVILLDAYRSLVAERLPEPVVPPKEFGVFRGVLYGVALSSLFWLTVAWVVVG